MMLHWETFSGTPFDIGRELGLYWNRRLMAFPKKQIAYRRLLKNEGNSHTKELLLSTGLRFPHLIEELVGLMEGARKGGYKCSLQGLFNLCLGEAAQCSTIALLGKRESSIAHNEEWDEKGWTRDPLCFARVRLLNRSEFLSVSYPFQLFGSSGGATSVFAFCGNSVKMSSVRDSQVKKTLHGRIPKTVLTRMMLEQKDVKSVCRLLRTCHSVLPSHWYFASQGSIYSLEMLPSANQKRAPANRISYKEIVDASDFHTNHFLTRKLQDWESGQWLSESRNSLRQLKKLTKNAQGNDREFTVDTLKTALKKHRNKRKKATSATIVFTVRPTGVTASGIDWSRKYPVKVKAKSLNKRSPY